MDNELNFITKNLVKIKDIMSRNIVYVSPDNNVKQVAEIMRDRSIGVVLIIDQNQNLSGMISERDIITKVVAFKLDPSEILVKDIMTRNLVTGNQEMTDMEASMLMSEKRIKKLPITENNKVIGIITQTDLMKVTLDRMEKVVLGMIEESKKD